MKSKFNFEIGPFNIRTSAIQAQKDYGKKKTDEMLKIFSEPPFYGMTKNRNCTKTEIQNLKQDQHDL